MIPGIILKFLNEDFDLLDNRKDRLLMIVICLAFSVLFINIFVPFNINRWTSDSGIIQFLRLSSYGVIVSGVFLFTQFPLRKWFGILHFKIKTYILWILIELSLISLVYIFLYGNPVGNFLNDFTFSIKYTFLGILIPYVFSLLCIYYQKQKSEIKTLNTKIKFPDKTKLTTFKDENENVKFSVVNSDLLFLESTDNYVTVYYLNNGKIHRNLIRNTLKRLEDNNLPNNLIRCHRSYIVNIQNIEFVRKAKKTLQIKLKNYNTLLSVSQKYKHAFQEIFN
ncbi:MAG: LytTR family transcriptional regulator [Bacteroidales bacterium]|nr:LytTR family transcriptional regulator [Bacteroidales bacterium]